jgi:hypothetical protein
MGGIPTKGEKIFVNLLNTYTSSFYILCAGKNGPMIQLWCFLVGILSMLMHISEQKHYLPGLWPFNKYTDEFLKLDRASTYFTIPMLLSIALFYDLIILDLTIFSLLTLSALFISERVTIRGGDTRLNLFIFGFFHTMWHIFSASILFKVLK